MDDIVNTKNISYYSQHRGYINEHFNSREEERAVVSGDQNNELYRRYKLRNKEYLVRGGVVFSGSDTTTLIKYRLYICDIKLHCNAQCYKYFAFIENIRPCRRVVSEFIDEDD